MTLAERVSHLVDHYQLNPVLAMHVASSVNDFSHENITLHLRSRPKPFVKWVGGKRQLLTKFRENNLYPPHKFNPVKNTYFEPFVGGGAVFFDLLPYKAHLNDLNAELVTTYSTIRDDVSGLISTLTNGYYIYDKERYLDIRKKDTDSLSDTERAARFIYLNRTAFNGLYRVNKSGGFNVPFGRYTNPQICDEDNLRKVSESLKHAKISNSSYKFVLDRAKAGDFVYFDPPYYPVNKTSSFTSYTADAFLEKEQTELRDTFIELSRRGCFVMLSNSDTPFILDLFEPFKSEGVTTHKVSAGRAINSNAGKRGKITEIVITNYT